MGDGEGTPLYGLDRYVPPEKVWFLRVLIFFIIFALVGIVFPVSSSDRVPKLYQLKFKLVNSQLHEKQINF